MCKIFIAAMLALALLAPAQTVDRTKPPQTAPIPAYKPPPIQEAQLGNGLQVVMVQDPRFPLVSVRLIFMAGMKYDPPELPGLAETAGSLLTEGTKSRTSRQIAEELATIGGSLTSNTEADGLNLSGYALSEGLPNLLELLADVSINANFPEDEIALRKQNRKQGLLSQMSDPAFLGSQRFNAVVYGRHPYSHVAPTMASLDKMDRKTLVAFRDTWLTPNNAVLILIGKLPPRIETMKLIDDRFGGWQKKEVPAAPKAALPPPKRQLVLVDRPGSVQADIHVGRLAVTRANPEYYPLLVGNVILGGGSSSRLFLDIREKRGFAYDAHTEMRPYKDAGTIAAVTQVRNEVLEEALPAVLQHLEQMGKERVSADELSDTKNFLSGTFLLRLETQNGLASQLATIRLNGLPNDYLEKYTARLRAVEPDQVLAASRKYIVPENSAIVVVGDASKIAKILEKFGTVTVTKAQP
jgi:zinc protease